MTSNIELVKSLKKAKAIFLDFDGTLASTRDVWDKDANEMFLRSKGIEVPENLYTIYKEYLKLPEIDHLSISDKTQHFFLNVFGITDKDTFIQRSKFVEEIYKTIPLHKGVIEFMTRMKEDGKTIILVTSARRSYLDCFLESNPDFVKNLDGIVAHDDVEIGDDGKKCVKPHPMPYNLACEMLEINPKEAITFEDSKEGIESANKAGVPVVAVCCQPEETLPCGEECKKKFGVKYDYEIKNFEQLNLSIDEYEVQQMITVIDGINALREYETEVE